MRSFKRDVAVERISDEHAECGAGVSADRRGIRRGQLLKSRTRGGVVGDGRVVPCRRPCDLDRVYRLFRRYQLREMKLEQAGADEVNWRCGDARLELNDQ